VVEHSSETSRHFAIDRGHIGIKHRGRAKIAEVKADQIGGEAAIIDDPRIRAGRVEPPAVAFTQARHHPDLVGRSAAGIRLPETQACEGGKGEAIGCLCRGRQSQNCKNNRHQHGRILISAIWLPLSQ
jgi:hypothetical protein